MNVTLLRETDGTVLGIYTGMAIAEESLFLTFPKGGVSIGPIGSSPGIRAVTLPNGRRLTLSTTLVETRPAAIEPLTQPDPENKRPLCPGCGKPLNNLSPGFGILDGQTLCMPCIKKTGRQPEAIAK